LKGRTTLEKSIKPLSVAIVGTGRIAGEFDQDRHGTEGGVYSHAGAYGRSGKFRIETVYDIDRERARRFKRYWNAGTVAESLEEICSGRHDVISVCTPDETHYDVLRVLIETRCCRALFTEKPLASDLQQSRNIIESARGAGIHVVVNLQRNFDPLYGILQEEISQNPENLLTINGYYMKGLSHCGVTMIDTLTALCGYPEEILAFDRTWNREVGEYSYDFILFYDHFNAVVKSIDSRFHAYTYHIFELDLLFSNKRITINDNSRRLDKRLLTDYAYGGVRVLDDGHPLSERTQYDRAILNGVEYVFQITRGLRAHTINTPEKSYSNRILIDRIIESYESGEKIPVEKEEWLSQAARPLIPGTRAATG
jgi:predicted dehydrogenase